MSGSRKRMLLPLLSSILGPLRPYAKERDATAAADIGGHNGFQLVRV